MLAEERSRTILKNFRGLATAREARPDQDALCLSCHVLPNPRLETISFPGRFLAADGVSCESCHGGARDWVAHHFAREWKELGSAEKEAKGFADTKNLLKRAKTCVGCHVGKQGMEVNHDLIAAGHPRLRFELGANLASYAGRHWSLRDEKSRYSDFEERAWMLGQLVSAQAALDLLAERAAGSVLDGTPTERPWPELAEFNCASCHHRLRPPGAKALAEIAPEGLKQGLPVWGTWYFSGLADLARGLGEPQARGLNQSLEELDNRMRNPASERADIAARARALSGQLEAITMQLERTPYDPSRSRALVDALLHTKGRAPDWESATQKYLGLRSISLTLRTEAGRHRGEDHGVQTLDQGLGDLGQALDRSFPAGRESLGASPDLYDKNAIRDLFDRLHKGPGSMREPK